jgi:hypothetical protein
MLQQINIVQSGGNNQNLRGPQTQQFPTSNVGGTTRPNRVNFATTRKPLSHTFRPNPGGQGGHNQFMTAGFRYSVYANDMLKNGLCQ